MSYKESALLLKEIILQNNHLCWSFFIETLRFLLFLQLFYNQ